MMFNKAFVKHMYANIGENIIFTFYVKCSGFDDHHDNQKIVAN